MTCLLTQRARLTRESSTRAQGKKHRAKKEPFMPFLPDLPDKLYVSNSLVQF